MTWIHLPFVTGQDQTPDSKIAPSGMLKRIEDCRIDKEGRIVKRRGYIGVDRTTWINGTIAGPLQGIWSREGERVAIGGDRLYSHTNQGWRDWGLLSNTGVPERREAIHNKVASMDQPSVAVIGQHVAVVGRGTQGIANSPIVQGVVFDAADWALRDQAGISTIGLAQFAPKVVAVGNIFVCVWADLSDAVPANWRLLFSLYDTTAATFAHWTAPAVLGASREAFDICPYSATHYLVVTGSNLYSATTAGIATTSAFTSLGAADGQMAVCGAPGENASIAWMDTASKTLRLRSWAGLAGNPFAGVTSGTITVGSNVAWSAGPTLTRKNSSTHTLAISTNPRGGLTGGVIAEQTDWIEFDPPTGTLGATATRYGFQLASKSQYIGEQIFTWGENFSTFERSYFLEAHTSQADATIQTTFARNEAAEVTTQPANLLTYPAPPSMATITLDGQLHLLTGLPFISVGSVARANPTKAVDLAQVPIGGVERYQSVEVGGCLYLAGGLLQTFDGQLAYELGFLTGPNIRGVVGGILASSFLEPNGVYQYVIVREWRDAQNQRHISQVSDPVSVTLGPTDNIATVTYDQNLQNNRTPRWLTGGAPGYQFNFITHIYRTLNGGTVFYRVTADRGIATPASGSGPALATYVDRAGDSTLAGPTGQNIVLYTQGQRGGLSGPLQHDPPPPCRYIWAGKDRVILGGLEHPDQVRWSKTFFGGEPLEFSEDLSFRKRVPGRVKAVSVIDDAWIVFTETRVYAIFGEGPDDSGIGAFSEPREIPSAVGCFDWRSLVLTPAGLIFQGRADALYLLPRGLGSPVEISRPVIDVLRLPGARITAARLVTAQGVVMFAIAADEGITRHLVHDLRTGQWVVDLPYDGGGNPPVGFAEWDSLLAWCTDSEIRIERPEYSDDDNGYRMMVETHPLRPGGLQRSIRCRRVEAIGEYRDSCALRIEAARDDADFSEDAQWSISGLTPGTQVRREWRLPVQKFGAVRFLLTVEDDGPVSPGLALTGITLESETRPGTPKLGIGNRA